MKLSTKLALTLCASTLAACETFGPPLRGYTPEEPPTNLTDDCPEPGIGEIRTRADVTIALQRYAAALENCEDKKDRLATFYRNQLARIAGTT